MILSDAHAARPSAGRSTAAGGVVEMSLDSYEPNRSGYETSFDGVAWQPVADEKSVANPLRLRVKAMRGMTGPEMAIVMFLADALLAR